MKIIVTVAIVWLCCTIHATSQTVTLLKGKVVETTSSGDYQVAAAKGQFSERYPKAIRVKLSRVGDMGESFRVASYANACGRFTQRMV